MSHRGALDEMLKQIFYRWSDTFMKLIVENTVSGLGFLTHVAVFVTRRVINAVEEELKQKPRVTKMFL